MSDPNNYKVEKVPMPSQPDALIEKYYDLDLFDVGFFLLIGEYRLLKDWAMNKEGLLPEAQKDFLEVLKESGESSYNHQGRQFPMSGGGSIIWVKPGMEIRILVHELVHAAMWMIHAKGIPISRENDEILAYIVERLYERFI